jgi:hypothetical protein
MSKNLFNNKDLSSNLFQECYNEVNNFFSNKTIEFPLYGIHKQIMVFYLALVRFYKINLVIESGVGMGYSTKYLIDFSEKFNIQTVSIDLNINQLYCKHRNVEFKKNSLSSFEEGDGFLKVSELVMQNKDKKIALFLDGPKHLEAISLHDICCLLSKNVIFSFIDDILVNSNSFKSLKNYNYFYIYDLLNKEKIFRENKKKVLESYFRLKNKNNKSEAELKSRTRISNLFVKREVILWNKTKNYLPIFRILFSPIIFFFLYKLKFSSKIILFFLKLFRKVNFFLNKQE